MDPATEGPEHAAPPAAVEGSRPDDSATPPVPAGATAPSRRAAVLRTGLVIGILVVVFGVILPRFIDYEDVIVAFRALTAGQLLLMTAFVAVAWLVSGLMFSVLIPSLSARRGTEAYLILSEIGASVPMGPWNMAVLWVVMRGWGVGIKPATSGILVYGVLNTLTRLVMPALTLFLLAIAGTGGDSGARVAMLIAILCTVVVVVAAAVMTAIVRSDRAAGWVARTVQAIVSAIRRRLGRSGATDVQAGVWAFRDQLGEVVRRRGLMAMVVGTAGQVVWCAVLVAALRIVGIPDEVLSPLEVLAVFAMVSVITIIPIAPGGAGIPELLYIGGLTAIAGPDFEALVTAGVMLFRLFQWFLPIPIAWMLLKVTRRGLPMLPTPTELRAYAAEGAA